MAKIYKVWLYSKLLNLSFHFNAIAICQSLKYLHKRAIDSKSSFHRIIVFFLVSTDVMHHAFIKSRLSVIRLKVQPLLLIVLQQCIIMMSDSH